MNNYEPHCLNVMQSNADQPMENNEEIEHNSCVA